MLLYGSELACIAVLATSAGCVRREARMPDTRPQMRTSEELSSSLPRPKHKNDIQYQL